MPNRLWVRQMRLQLPPFSCRQCFHWQTPGLVAPVSRWNSCYAFRHGGKGPTKSCSWLLLTAIGCSRVLVRLLLAASRCCFAFPKKGNVISLSICADSIVIYLYNLTFINAFTWHSVFNLWFTCSPRVLCCMPELTGYNFSIIGRERTTHFTLTTTGRGPDPFGPIQWAE